MRSPLASLCAVAAVAALALTGCTSAPPTPTPTAAEPVASIPPVAEDLVMDPVSTDALLVIHATATAPNGSRLALQFQVHPSARWDDEFNLNVPAIMVEDCPDLVSQKDFSDEQWAFSRSNANAIPVDGTPAWPAGSAIAVKPSGDTGDFVVTRGLLSEDPTGAPACHRPTVFTLAGKGGLALGIPGDADALTGWAQYAYGFSATDAGVTLSDCVIEVTPAGAALDGGGGNWSTVSDETACLAGAADKLS